MATRTRPEVLGDIAHDSAETTTAHPVKIGGYAVSHDGTAPPAVAEADRVNAMFDRQGAQYVNSGHPYFFHTSAAFTEPQTVTTQFVTAPGANLSIYVTDVVVGGNAAGQFHIAYGSAVTAGATTIFRSYIPAGGNFNHSFRIPLKLAANNDLSFLTDISQTSVNIFGYIAP